MITKSRNSRGGADGWSPLPTQFQTNIYVLPFDKPARPPEAPIQAGILNLATEFWRIAGQRTRSLHGFLRLRLTTHIKTILEDLFSVFAFCINYLPEIVFLYSYFSELTRRHSSTPYTLPFGISLQAPVPLNGGDYPQTRIGIYHKIGNSVD